jgi:CheY-like chemotaxis protein
LGKFVESFTRAESGLCRGLVIQRVQTSLGQENAMVTRNILIVEDEPAVALSFQHMLKRSLEYNYHSQVVSSAEEAFEAIKKTGAFDVILLDYYLPGLTGGDFLRALRTDDQETVVIVISASQEYKIVHEVFKLGADDYITKEELSNPYVLEKALLAGLEKREYQKELNRVKIERQRIDAITTIIRTVHHESDGHHRSHVGYDESRRRCGTSAEQRAFERNPG